MKMNIIIHLNDIGSLLKTFKNFHFFIIFGHIFSWKIERVSSFFFRFGQLWKDKKLFRINSLNGCFRILAACQYLFVKIDPKDTLIHKYVKTSESTSRPLPQLKKIKKIQEECFAPCEKGYYEHKEFFGAANNSKSLDLESKVQRWNAWCGEFFAICVFCVAALKFSLNSTISS